MFKFIILLMTMLVASTAGADDQTHESWRLRCTKEGRQGFAIEVTANKRKTVDAMHAAMLRQSTISPKDFCVITTEH